MYGVHISYFFVKNTLQMLENYGIIIIEWESIIIKKRKYAAPRHIYNRLTQLLLCKHMFGQGPFGNYLHSSLACVRACASSGVGKVCSSLPRLGGKKFEARNPYVLRLKWQFWWKNKVSKKLIFLKTWQYLKKMI